MTTSRAELNKRLTIKYFDEVFNKQKFDVITELLSPLYTFNGEPSSVEGNKAWVISLHQTYPGLHFSIEAILAEEDQVALRWKMEAPANGDRPAGFITGTNIITFADGQALSNVQNSQTSPSWSHLSA